MPRKKVISDYNEYQVITTDMGTFVEGGDGYTLRQEQLNTGWEVEDTFHFTEKQEKAIFAYMNNYLKYDVQEKTQTYYVGDFTINDDELVLEALHEAIYVLFDKEIVRWSMENYDEPDNYGI